MVMIPRKLAHLDKQKLIDHFLNDIVDNDRRLRFGFEAPDSSVKEYIDNSIKYDYGYTSMWFIVDEGDRIVATCHVSLNRETNTAEIGLTVSPDYRNQKSGKNYLLVVLHGLESLVQNTFSCTAFLRIK
jgi:RimJ/RimL family protein N-acetyltransferase